MPISTINSKGQTTVPKEVREALDLDPGDKLNVERERRARGRDDGAGGTLAPGRLSEGRP